MLGLNSFRRSCLQHARLVQPQVLLTQKSFNYGIRFNSRLPQSTDPNNDLQSNDIKSRLPKFSLHKDVAPTLLPKPDTPRVGPGMTFPQLMDRFRHFQGPELLYMAESHRLYFMACFALAFITAYNMFDLVDQVVPVMIKSYDDNDLEGTPIENLGQLVKRFGLVGVLACCYLVAGLTFATIPSRLVRRMEYIPGSPDVIRMVTHPWIPGRPSPVVSVPVANLSIGKRTKVWTGEGFYGTLSKSSFFFFVWEKGRRLPWIVDRSGWFWGDGRVYDVVLGKEPVLLAEKGISYDDALRHQMAVAEKKKAELRRELGPAWRYKAMGQLMKEDIDKFSAKGKSAVLGTLKQKPKTKGVDAPKDDFH